MSKRIVYLSNCELLAYQVQGKQLFDFKKFTLDATGQAELASYLQQDLKTPVCWLVDSTQEEYQSTLLPHVGGGDRKALLKHRMRRMFEDTDYTYAEVQGRETGGRGDDKVLFTALNNPEDLKPWLAVFAQHKIPLAGLYSLPLLSQLLIRYLSRADYHLLVVHNPPLNHNSPYALRQNFFLKQKLQLSRLVALSDSEPNQYATTVVSQTLNTLRYLNTARLLSQSIRVAVTFIVPPAMRPALKQQVQQQGIVNADVSIIDTHQLADKFNLQYPDNIPLYLHHFIAPQLSPLVHNNHYATLQDTRYFWLQAVRKGLYWSAGLVLVIAIVWVLSGAFSTWQHIQTGLQAQQQQTMRRAELQALRASLPELKIDIIHLRSIVDTGRFLNARHLLPQPSWYRLSQTLLKNEKILIKQLAWATAFDKPNIFKQAPSEDLLPTESGFAQRAFFERLSIEGTVDGPRGNYRQNNQIFNRFIEMLRQDSYAEWQVVVVAPPYSDNPNNPSLSTPAFSLELQVIHRPQTP